MCCNGTHWEMSATTEINMNATVQHQIFNGVWLCNLIFSVWMTGKSHDHKLSGLVSKQEETELVAFSEDYFCSDKQAFRVILLRRNVAATSSQDFTTANFCRLGYPDTWKPPPLLCHIVKMRNSPIMTSESLEFSGS